MEATPEAFRAICDYHATGGTTSLLLTTATAPLAEIVKVLQAVRECRAEFPQIAGVHVEGPFISREKAGAQRAEFITNPESGAVEQLLEYRGRDQTRDVGARIAGRIGSDRAVSRRGDRSKRRT